MEKNSFLSVLNILEINSYEVIRLLCYILDPYNRGFINMKILYNLIIEKAFKSRIS